MNRQGGNAGGDDFEFGGRRGDMGATCDRLHRKAWPGMPLRSTYAHLLTLPAHLAAGDKAGAAAVHRQLLALLERGGWTAAESGRLRKMEKDWRRRLAGEDAKFNVAGWARQGTGHHTSRTVAELDKIRRRIQDGNWEDAE